MATKRSTVSALFDTFVDVLSEELSMYKNEKIPMAAADKATFLALFKHCDITPDPDSTEMEHLREQFSANEMQRRDARAAELLRVQDDPLSKLLQ